MWKHNPYLWVTSPPPPFNWKEKNNNNTRIHTKFCMFLWTRRHIYLSKKETSASHLCLLIPNECNYFIQLFCFNKVDHLEMLCTKQNSIRWSLVPITTPQVPVPKFRKSQNQCLVCPSFSLTIAVHPVSLKGHTSELLCMPSVFFAVMTAGINLSHKCDVTNCRS